MAEAFTSINSLAGNLAGLFILAAIIAIFMIKFIDNGAASAFALASFIAFGAGIFLTILGVITFHVLIIFIILCAAGATILVVGNR